MMPDKTERYSGTIDSSRIESKGANVFEVMSNPGEIVLAFGNMQPVEAVRNDGVTAYLANRIIMAPSIAKRFAALLARKVQEYESVFGPLDREVPTLYPQEQNSLPADSPTYASEKTAEKARSLARLIDGLGVEYGLERSFKISDRSLLMNRFIMGFKKDQLPGDPDKTMGSVFMQMGMPGAFIDECRALLPQTEYFHFGFEEQRTGCLYKAYLEFKVPIEFGTDGSRIRQEPFLVFLGFKWNPFDGSTRAMSRYTCYPLLSPEEIQEKLACLFERNPEYKSFETAQNIVQNSVKVISNDKIIYEEVSEENNPRKSFDMNLYGADLCIRDIYPLLMDIGRHYSLPDDQFVPLCDRIRDKRFGHLSGGIDREGKDFLTVYYGVERVQGSRL